MIKQKETYKTEIVFIKPITRKEAKYYIKNCEYCEEIYNRKEKLFLMYSRDVCQENPKIFTNDNHIYNLTQLNEGIREIQFKNNIKMSD